MADSFESINLDDYTLNAEEALTDYIITSCIIIKKYMIEYNFSIRNILIWHSYLNLISRILWPIQYEDNFVIYTINRKGEKRLYYLKGLYKK